MKQPPCFFIAFFLVAVVSPVTCLQGQPFPPIRGKTSNYAASGTHYSNLHLLSTNRLTKNSSIAPAIPIDSFQELCICGKTGNYTANSTYQYNLDSLTRTVPTDASSPQMMSPSTPRISAFSNATYGTVPDRVSALALCRGDVRQDECYGCLSNAFSEAQNLCPYNNDVTIYRDVCLLRYSNENILTSTFNSDEVKIWSNPQFVTSPAARFDAAVAVLVNATAVYAASNSSNKFATSDKIFEEDYSKIYGLAQCTPDLTAADCRSCLGDLIGMMPRNFSGKQGGRILGVRCNLRYDVSMFYNGEAMLQLSAESPASSPAPRGRTRKLWIIAAAAILAVLLFCIISCFIWTRKRRKGRTSVEEQARKTLNIKEELRLWRMQESNSEFSFFDLSQMADATANFSDGNRLGEGGFGSVYKGQLSNGLTVAIKRLASHSGQGLTEFKNEIQLIAKLQHTNLVRLLGCCIEGEEKMLIYEYMQNKSLDFFIFDATRGTLLNWNKRLHIVRGIAEGLLYLHKHSRLRIIHRDLKASNILLDYDMNPKISDFGLARIFGSNDTQANTRRVVGTYGYMAPEYASEGLFSIKSDVFSFGVLLLEIVSGKRNAGFHRYGDFLNLLGYAWQLWKEGRWFELIDASLHKECQRMEMMRCINIALMCVQENAVDRPTMSDVVATLSNDSVTLPQPKQPAYFNVRVADGELSNTVEACSVNDVTITGPDGR